MPPMPSLVERIPETGRTSCAYIWNGGMSITGDGILAAKAFIHVKRLPSTRPFADDSGVIERACCAIVKTWRQTVASGA